MGRLFGRMGSEAFVALSGDISNPSPSGEGRSKDAAWALTCDSAKSGSVRVS
jgi:hypothetical protein